MTFFTMGREYRRRSRLARPLDALSTMLPGGHAGETK
jgi:hypothetical protein